jgi:hypothetical protein
VISCFPAHEWMEWRFNFRAKESKNEIIDFIKKMEKEHKISPDQDGWYGLPLSEIKDTTKLEFIKRHGGLHGMKGGNIKSEKKTNIFFNKKRDFINCVP